jgi:PBP1b-binding outer membrane lipoprotein LpoB
MKQIFIITLIAFFFTGCIGSVVALPFKAVGKTIELTGDVVEAVVP